MERLTVLVFQGRLEEYLGLLRERLQQDPELAAAVELQGARTPEEAARLLPRADVLLVSGMRDPSYLRHARRLRWIQTTSAGVEPLLESGLVPPGCLITRHVGTFGLRIAEYVLAHMLAVTQRIPEALRLQAERRWRPFLPDVLAGKTVGIAGLGHIGGAVARRCAALGLKVLGCSRTPPRDALPLEEWYPAQDRKAMLSRCHFVVLCLPLTPETRGFIGAEELAAMPRHAWLINVGRGALVDEEALVAALREGRLGGAVLDVFTREPLPPDSPLWDLPQVRITPHIAGVTLPHEAVEEFVANLRRFLAGQPLLNPVDPARGY